jgi:uncharacterized protein
MKFTSFSGNSYWFDNTLGITFPLTPSLEKKMLMEPGDKGNIDHQETDTDAAYNSIFVKKIERLKQHVLKFSPLEITPETMKKSLLREGLTQLTLSVTENCNLRCRYCYYSDYYPQSRNPSQKKMDFSTAKAAMDQFASLLMEGARFNPQRETSIGFYGGEPLLNYKLIRECISYFEKTYPDINPQYSMTTNGTLLDTDKCDFLMAHEFSVAVSIDGPEEEHNRNRVYQDGSGTFNDVMKNIRPMVDAGYDKCHILCVYDWDSDLFALQDFFDRDDVPRLSNISLPNVNDGCTYFEQFSDNDYQRFIEKRSEAFQWYCNHGITIGENASFFDILFGIRAGRTIYSTPALMDTTTSVFPYTGTCIPGRKIFVDVNGNYHICERINPTLPIGNIHMGLDFHRITEIVRNYNAHLDKCPTCTTSKTCGLCYCAFTNNGSFTTATQSCHDCNDLNGFRQAFTLGEINPRLPESLVEDYYSWLSTISTTGGD